ncbi:MAG: 50S ribosomal protein L13 [Candidatus Marinimicrobia bacterium]|nr:50S ribosomal protein L13 [Candidatus Neomarinimicrobiota bacterium]
MKTKTLKLNEINKDWWIADAEGQTLGRFASKIAQVLRGKHKPEFSPHLDMGDCVIVINADKIKVSGKKETKKTYFRHSGYPGGDRETSLQELRQKFPERIIENAVKGMLPHNRLGRAIYGHLKVYVGDKHPHSAQQPKELEV